MSGLTSRAEGLGLDVERSRSIRVLERPSVFFQNALEGLTKIGLSNRFCKIAVRSE